MVKRERGPRLITFNAQKTGTKILVTIHPDLEDHLRTLARNPAVGPLFPAVAGCRASPPRTQRPLHDVQANYDGRWLTAASVESGKAREGAARSGGRYRLCQLDVVVGFGFGVSVLVVCAAVVSFVESSNFAISEGRNRSLVPDRRATAINA